MAASIALGRGGKGLFAVTSEKEAVTASSRWRLFYRPDADRRPNSERAGHHSHVAATFWNQVNTCAGAAAHVRRKGYADGRRQQNQCPARAALQDEITRLTALGPLPFLSGSTSNVMRCPSVKSIQSGPLHCGDVNEHIAAAVIGLDSAIASSPLKKFTVPVMDIGELLPRIVRTELKADDQSFAEPNRNAF